MPFYTTSKTSIDRLYILDFGRFQVHSNNRIIGIPGYLITTTGQEHILVDTGFPLNYITDPVSAAEEDNLGSFGRILELSAVNTPDGQLAQIGLKREDVSMLIMTHTDIDHVGGIADFPGAEMIIGKAERALPQPRYFDDKSPISWPKNVKYRLIDEDTELFPGLTVLPTPGHAPGHLSILVRLPNTGPVLLTCDAVSRPAEIEEGFKGVWNPASARESAARLMTIAEEENALVIYGHDPDQWHGLKKAPDYYD